MQRGSAWPTTNGTGTGYEPRAAASSGSSRPADVRWGRLAFAQLRDEEFLAKQLRRIEMTQGARREGRSPAPEATTSTGLSPGKTIRQRLATAQAKAARAASEDDDFDAKAETSRTEMTGSGDAEERDERALTNALCVLGDLQQPELAAFMGVTLKDALRRVCTFPNPIYQLIALRRQLMKSMHEAVAAQHRQRKAAVQLNVSIAQRLETSLLWTPQAADPVGLLSGSGAIKPKEKASREAAMGIQVLVCLLTDLQDATLASITQRREFLEDLLPLLRETGFLALSPRRGLSSNSSALCSSTSRGLNSTGPAPGAAEIAEFTEKLQRFLLAMCPRPTNVPSSSPTLLAISSGGGELDVLDRTNAANGLIHVAAATGSVRDFLVVLTVLLGANDYVAESGTKDLRTSLLTSSVPSLVTEELLPSPINSGRDDDEVMQGRRSAKEAGATRPDSGQPQNGSPLGKRETDLLGDSAAQDPLRRKTLSKGLKTIVPSSNAGTPTAVNLAMPHSSAAQQRLLLFSSPGNNLVSKQMAKDELKDAILMGNASLSLDMSKMKETLARDPVMTTRSEIPVMTARCPKFKALAVQSVLLELDRAKPSVPTRASRAKPTSSLHASHAGCFSTEPSAFAGDDDDGGDREVWTCGQNSYGELGHGDTASRKSFERVEALQQKDIVQVGAGNEHTIALTADGRALTCGYNDNGQCGQGGTARVSHLSEVPKLNAIGISQVHAYNGCEHTIVVTADGRAATCGYNYRGQLGHGNTASESVPKLVRSLENKVVRLVSCSYYHTVLACEEDGSGQHCLYTFGRNDYGQLGHNDSIDRKIPQHVEALSDQHVVSVACGQYHTMVVTATGKAFAFGKNDYGQLGMESMENQLVPVQVRTGLEKHECLEICCGYYHTIVLCSGAHVFGFGRNDYGQLGLGSPHASSAANLQLQQQRFSSARLIEELEGKDIVRFACGCYHTLAVSDNGVMYVFGRNNHGQLGTGDTSERVYPFPIDDFVGKRVALVAAGFYHTVVLTGGKDDEKNDQDAGSAKADIATTTSVPSGITHTAILSAPAVQELLDPSKRPELGNSGLTKSFISRDDPDAGAEVPAIDPTDDDFRDEDSQVRRNASSSAGGGATRPQADASDALFVAVVVLAQLDRLCQPFLPKSGSYPTLQHPSMSVIESLTTSAASSSSAASFDASCVFDGSFESFGIHNCSSTFESLAVLLKHLSTKKVETASQLPCCLGPPSGPSSAVTATPRRPTQPNATHHLQLYMLLASIRVLQANMSQLLRSGMAKAIVLLSPGTPACKSSTADSKPWATELDRTRVAVLQVREVLLSLVDIKHRRNVCYVLDNAPSEGENATRVAEEAAATLMQGFELFFPCECLQRQFCLHTMQELASNDSPEHSCGLLCRRDLWLIDTLPKSKTLLLEQLLRRMTEDPLIARFLPLVSADLPIPSAGPPENERGRPSLVTEVYQLLLERTAAGFSRRLGGVVAFRPSSETPPRQETTFRAFFEALGGLQKHLSSWAASVHEWTLKQDSEVEQQPGGDMEEIVASVVDRVFRVDEQDLARVPVPWRCFIEFALATLAQCCEALGQASSLESLPSPTHGYDHRVELGAESLHSKMLDAVEHSVVGQFLPLLVVSLFEFSNNSLFAAALLPTLKSLLRLLDGFNRGDGTVEEAEKLFVESVASSCSPRAPQNESAGSFRWSNLLALGSARDDDGKTASRKAVTTSDAIALPWHFRLEKELAVLAAEMAVTLVIGDPFFTYDGVESGKLSARWLASPLFRGGLNANKLTQSIKRTSSTRSKHARVVAHTPFPGVLGVHAAPFSLILPPASANRCTIPLWQLPTAQSYGEMFRPDSVKTFLLSLRHWGESENQEQTRGAATKLCDWVRDKYATKDPSYRMLMRQSQLSMNLKAAANALERRVHDNDTRIEAAFFAACLHHNVLGAQACHFALGLDQSPPEQRSSSPRAFIRLWQCVAQLRRRVAVKKTEIKNTPHADSESPLGRIAALQQTILDRCELLLLVDVHDEQEHLNLQLDAGYIAPYDPAFLVSASSSFTFGASSAKRHLHATYSDGKLPFLAAFPSSKWRRVRTLLHTMTRWKFVAAEFRPERQDGVSQEVLAYVTSDEPVASKNAIKTLLVDPCRRVSCSVRGLEALWELVTLVSFDSVQADIVHQVSHVFVSKSSASCPSILAGSRSLGFFFSSLQNEAFSEFLGQVTEMMTDKAALMMASDATSSFWVVIVLLSAWGVHFSTEQFEFVSEIGILRVIQEMLHGLSSQSGGCDTSADASPSIPSVDSIVGRSAGQQTLNQFATRQQLSRLEDALWVVFRFICVHFAVQTVHGEAASGRDVDVPTFPVLADVTELLYNEAAWISNRFLPLLASDDGNAVESTRADPVAGVRRSFEAITLPHRFSPQSRGATFSYDAMISPSGCEPTTPMSPLTKPNEFSVTAWLFINCSPAPRSQTMDGDLFDLTPGLQDRQLVLVRGAGREISLYVVLVPESSDNWQLEVGILMDLDREAGAAEFSVRGRVWERVLSKQSVAGGSWIHVAVVLEATKLRLYLNGVLDCQRSLAAQSVPIWAAGNVDLPLHFGRFPTAFEPTATSSSVSLAIEFLSRSLGIMNGAGMTPSNNASEQKTGCFRCFDGWLSHFRFHNRSLSPIHVRIVFDEKKSPSGVAWGANEQSKLVELHALVILLSSSSEGLVHFTSQFPKWMRLIWGTFLGSNSAVVQQSALRVLRALMSLQPPLEASKVLVQECTHVSPEALGFYNLEDVFAQQVVRMIGFCLSKCPPSNLLSDPNDAAVVSWPLMVARGIHASQFSPEVRGSADQQTDLPTDVELRYQSSKRQSLMLANELNQLLQQLFRCSNDAWRRSVIRVTSRIARDFSGSCNDEALKESEPLFLQFGKHTLHVSTIKRVESVGCFYFLGGGVEFLRPGVKVEMRGSRERAQVLSLEHHTSSQNAPETAAGSKAPAQVSDTLAYVRMDSNSSVADLVEFSTTSKKRNGLTWYEMVFDSKTDPCRSYSKVHVDELHPAEATNPNTNESTYPSIIYDLTAQQSDHNVVSALVEKAAEVIPLVCSAEARRGKVAMGDDLVSMNVGCLLLKILVQIAGTGAGVDKLLAKPALIDVIAELAASQDSNPRHDTLYHVEKRVSALRREVYTALVELGDDGESELARALDSSSEKRSRSSSRSARTPPLSGEELTFSTPRGTGRRSLTPSETEALRESDAGVSDADDDGPANENWDQGDDEDGDEGEDDEEDEEDLEDDDEDEETRAEFVEELMLMGFPEDWCVLALKQTENDIVSASAWIVDNLEYLSKLQSTLDKERDKGRDSPRFDEEEDDVVPPDDAPQPPALNSSISSSENDQEKATGDSPSNAVKPGAEPGFDGTAPPLNGKEMGRKLFGEMYFPFEDGGFLSNTKSRFMCSWRADALEMKAPSAPHPIADNSPDAPRSAFDEDFQTDTNQLDLRGLIEQLRRCENTLAILYARQCMVTLLHQTTSARFPVDSAPRLSISYAQWLQLLKLVLLRGDQFAIVSRTDNTTKTPRLQAFSVDEVFAKAMSCLVDRDATSVATASLAFCLDELEAAAAGKRFEAVLWTQRDLQRPDKTVAEEPGIEVVVWLLDVLLAGPTSSCLCLPAELVKSVLRRLRCCLGTTNLPLKFVALRTISRLLVVTGTQAKDAVIESQLVVREFVAAASVRHSREVMQGRLLFSQYLQGYVELVHLLQGYSGFSDLSVARNPTDTSSFISSGRGGECRPQSLVSSLLPPTTPSDPKPDGSSLHFDRKRSRSSLLAFADDGLSVSYSGNEVWKAACAVVGFSTGIHSWVVRIDKSSSPYLFVGVATRQANLDSFLGADNQSWGFIGDKALYYQRNRVRAYGEPFTEGDCIGVRLDCEKGELSFSKNGVDLGLAFDNVVGEVCPAVAFYSRQQKISFAVDSCVSSSGTSEPRIGEDESASVEDCVVACELMANWVARKPLRAALCAAAFKLTSEWLAGSTRFVTTRSGKSLWVDVTSTTCGALGFHCEDRVRTPRGDGLVVGAAGGRVWVEVDNEPGAWFVHPSKLRLVTMASSATTSLPIPPVETGTAQSNSTLSSSRKDSSSDRVEAPSVPFTLSLEELVEYGEHALWSVAVDRELLSVLNDFCEVSRLSPWNVTPSQLLALIEDKTSVLELTNVASVLAMPREELEKMAVARFALLRFCNMYVSRALPFFDLTWHYFLPASSSLPCRLVSECRGSLFICVKNALWTALMDKTANAPKRADDEYDYPEDLPQLQVNRLKAAAAKCHEGSVSSLFLSLFGQAFEELHFLPLKTLRMVYSHPMDDGQLRSFKVKFEGEGVDDYGGPYREFFSQFFAELQMLQVPESGEDNANTGSDHSANGGPSSTSMHLDPGVSVSACVLPFLLPSPNWRNGVGANREKFVLNGALIARPEVGDTPTLRGESGEEKRQLYCEMFFFLGQMIGICLRTRVCVRLDLAMSVWKQLVAEEASAPETALETMREIDFVAYSLWKTLKGFSDELKRLETGPDAATTGTKQRELEEQLEAMDLVFTTVLSDGRTVELCEDGTNTAVTRSNLAQYLDAMLGARVGETEQVLNIVKQGLHSIMPVSALALLTWTELEKRMCGVAEVDVKLLQANTEYDEELAPSDDFIQRFWRVLEGLEAEDKRAFLRFVWARSRLPLGSAQFHQKFKIQALASTGSGDGNSSSSGATASAGGWMDSQMPKSHTCFFALQLPRYSTDEICRERLLYAVRNCVEMDGDFRLADTEMTGWTGISPTDQLRI